MAVVYRGEPLELILRWRVQVLSEGDGVGRDGGEDTSYFSKLAPATLHSG